MKVNEIFFSIQGEGGAAGLPCVFVRTTYCNLRCVYCDTERAFLEGEEKSIDEILEEVKKFNCNLVELTGGEPLVQKDSFELVKILCDNGYKVLIETSGSLSIKEIDKRTTIIMDLKCPSSGMCDKNLYSNVEYLKNSDEIKFVVGDRNDYNWMKAKIKELNLFEKYSIFVSPVFGVMKPNVLAEWILEDKINARLQLQLHKYIWDPNARGV